MIKTEKLTKVFRTEDVETFVLNQEGATILRVTHSDLDAAFVHRTINLLDGQVISESKV